MSRLCQRRIAGSLSAGDCTRVDPIDKAARSGPECAPGRARRGPEPWQCAGARASGGDAGRSPPAGGWGRYSRKMVRNTAVLQWILRVLASTAFRIARWRSIAERDKSARVRDQRSRRDQELQDTMATARVREGRLAARRARGRQRGCANAQAQKAGRARAQVCGALSVWEIFA
jgi:hypothetical protein